MHFANPCVYEIAQRAVIRVTGEDAASFLQGQFSNELRKPTGSATYGLWLDQKGKVIADSDILKVAENEFLIVSESGEADVIQKRLEDYLVADEVTLKNETAATTGFLVCGDRAGSILAELLQAAPTTGQFAQAREVMAYASRRTAGECFRVFGARAAVDTLRARLKDLGVKSGDLADLEFARVAAGIAGVPSDVGPGDLPNEAGLEDVAISYTKGCYLGQEVMARLKNLGQVRRRLHVIRGTGAAPASRAALFQGEKKVGEVRSVASRGVEYVGLAMISLVNFQPGVGVSLTPGGSPEIAVQANG